MNNKLLSGPYLSSFCMELSLVLKAGISLSEGVLMLSEDETDRQRKEMMIEIYKKMDAGESLHKAMGDAGCFPKYVVDMVEIGTKTGRLEAVLKALSEHYDRQEQISRSIKNAVVYPTVLLVMLLLVVIVLLTKVLPIFNNVFNQLGTDMSPLAVSLMHFGNGVNKYAFIIIAVILVLVLLGLLINKIPTWRIVFTRWWNKVNSSNRLNQSIASARFASAMAMTLASGLDTEESLNMVERITDNQSMKDKIVGCKKMISEGSTFTEAVSTTKVFPSLYCRMISIGFKTGSSDTVMSEVARRSEENVNDEIETVINRVEPTLVIVMSVIVGLILLSVMLPLMGIMTTIG